MNKQHKSYRALILLSFLSSSTILATPLINERTTHYPIAGTNATELRQEMNSKGPISDGRHYDAHTKWSVTWHYTYLEKDNQCSIIDIKINTDITYTLPDWINYQEARSGQQEKWDNYLSHLLIHERGHADNGKDAAMAIDAALSSLLPMENCQTLSTSANQRAADIISEYQSKDAAYDTATNHGLTQGARFP